jgi:hypothetical protein
MIAMSINRLNYTGRRRINRRDVRIVIYDRGIQPPEFDADLRLKEYRLPADALVFVEAYRQTRWMRFEFGRVGALVPPIDRTLGEFDCAEGILFRVRVTSAAGRKGVVLAEADQIRAKRSDNLDDERVPLLPVQPADLGHLVWKVDFSDDPVLLINRTLDWRAVASSPPFRSLVCPAALREVLTRILFQEDYPDLEDWGDWKAKWLRFGSGLPGCGDVPGEDENDRYDEWIDVVTEAFARQVNMIGLFTEYWHEEAIR